MKITRNRASNGIHLRVREGSALERYLSKTVNASTNATTALHELAVAHETLKDMRS